VQSDLIHNVFNLPHFFASFPTVEIPIRHTNLAIQSLSLLRAPNAGQDRFIDQVNLGLSIDEPLITHQPGCASNVLLEDMPHSAIRTHVSEIQLHLGTKDLELVLAVMTTNIGQIQSFLKARNRSESLEAALDLDTEEPLVQVEDEKEEKKVHFLVDVPSPKSDSSVVEMDEKESNVTLKQIHFELDKFRLALLIDSDDSDQPQPPEKVSLLSCCWCGQF
jgi:hypothetical protein